MKYRTALLFCLVLVFSACTPARNEAATLSPAPALPASTNTAAPTSLEPTQTITPTVAPTMTSTPVPPLVAHQWNQSEPLITFTKGCGDNECGYGQVFPIQFTLMPTGGLYVASWNEMLRRVRILTATLPRLETCRLLNSVDQAGFFDYDPSSYVPDPRTWLKGPENTYISVHAWRAKSVSLPQLDALLDQEKVDEFKRDWADCVACGALELPTILPAIRNTYRLLDQYRPETLQVLKLERLGVWVDAFPSINAAVEWPLKARPLADAISPQGHSQVRPNMILTGTDARQVYDALSQSCDVCSVNVREGDKIYRVFSRPLLPNELMTSPLPKVSFSCSPADGWVQAP